MGMTASFANIGKVPELRQRVLFTLALLAVYRLGIFVTVPGVDRGLMQEFIEKQSGNLFGMFNMFVGGALEQASVFSLGIMPYISSSIILQLLTVVCPVPRALSKEGELGRPQDHPVHALRHHRARPSPSRWPSPSNLEQVNYQRPERRATNPGWGFRLMTILTLTDGHRCSSCGWASRSPSAASATACR
jgi:preprotein translocase subunit SecY